VTSRSTQNAVMSKANTLLQLSNRALTWARSGKSVGNKWPSLFGSQDKQ
jgi:hypothetical protein